MFRFAALALVLLVAASGARAQPADENIDRQEIRLYGVVVQEPGGTALLRFGDRRPRVLRVGESESGFLLLEVSGSGVVLRPASGTPFHVPFPEPGPAPAPPEAVLPEADPPPPPEAPPAEERSASDGIDGADLRGPGELASPPLPPAGARASGERRFSRDEVRLRLASELPRILTGAVVAPRVLGNEVVGLELIDFPTDTLLGETGLAPGDVLMEVNGREVRGMESLAILAQRFQTARELELQVERAGEVMSLRYLIE